MPKALVPLYGKPLLEHALDNIARARTMDEVIVVLPPGDRELVKLCAGHPLAPTVIPGGNTRNDSVRAGLSVMGPGTERVLIHDAARCLTPPETFESVAAALAAGATAVIPVMPVVDTIKTVSQDVGDAHPHVTGTPPRDSLRAVQTPQGFHAPTLIAAHTQADGWDKATSEAITDDAMLMEMLGKRVSTVSGSPEALKITTTTDLLLAESLLATTRTEGTPVNQPDQPLPVHSAPMLIPRTGIGIDVHAVADESEPREMWLAGLRFPGVQGLSGHSDGDAVAHAACDALFSAAGIGDLGTHFGTDRPEYAGASGTTLLTEAARLVRAAGFEIGNVAVQFVGRRPKFAARRLEADAVLSAAAGAPVTVTATTSDGLGYEGTGEGLTAYATALVYSVQA